MHWTKKLLSFLLPLVLICLLSACDQTNQETRTDEVPEAAALPALRIGVDELKPFFYLDETGAYAGADAEIALEACRRAGYTPQFVVIPWSERDTYLENGSVDCLWTAFIQDGREESYLWTEPYLESKLAAIVDQESPEQSADGLRCSVAVRAGSKAEDLFRSNNRLETGIYACGTFDMAKTAFVKGYVGALAGHEIVLRQVMEDTPGLYRFLSDEMMPVPLGVAFAKDDTTGRCQALNDAIQSMREDGTLAAIAEKYGLDLPGEKGESSHAAEH